MTFSLCGKSLNRSLQNSHLLCYHCGSSRCRSNKGRQKTMHFWTEGVEVEAWLCGFHRFFVTMCFVRMLEEAEEFANSPSKKPEKDCCFGRGWRPVETRKLRRRNKSNKSENGSKKCWERSNLHRSASRVLPCTTSKLFFCVV